MPSDYVLSRYINNNRYCARETTRQSPNCYHGKSISWQSDRRMSLDVHSLGYLVRLDNCGMSKWVNTVNQRNSGSLGHCDQKEKRELSFTVQEWLHLPWSGYGR